MSTFARALTLTFATGLAGLAMVSCSGSGQVAQDLSSADNQFIEIYKPEPVGREAAFTGEDSGDVRPLMTTGGTQIGTATTWNDLIAYYVKIEADAGYDLRYVALEISPTATFIGLPFLYDYQQVLPGGSEYTFEVALEEAGCGTEFFASAFAFVRDGGGEGYNSFAHGAGAYDLLLFGTGYPDSITPFCTLPEGTITMTPSYPNAPDSYWGPVFGGFGAGFDIVAGTEYLGWCVDLAHYLSPGQTVPVTLHSSYAHDLPSYAQSSNWDMINYVLNHKSGDSYLDVQHAIWFFKGTGAYPSDPDAQNMVNDALANGEGFVPGPDDVTAVICDPGSARQLIIIEVVCGCAAGSTGIPGEPPCECECDDDDDHHDDDMRIGATGGVDGDDDECECDDDDGPYDDDVRLGTTGGDHGDDDDDCRGHHSIGWWPFLNQPKEGDVPTMYNPEAWAEDQVPPALLEYLGLGSGSLGGDPNSGPSL